MRHPLNIVPYKKRSLDYDVSVDVYRNLSLDKTAHAYSVRQDGHIIGHTSDILIIDAKLIVQPAGRQRVIDTGQRNVHAWVRGQVLDEDVGTFTKWYALYYNPFKSDHFLDGFGHEIGEASLVSMTKYGVEYTNQFYIK